MRVVRQKKKALSTMEELERDAASDLGHGFTYSRSLLSEVRAGKGKHYKELKDILDATPERKERYQKHKEVEATMKSVTQQMMWSQEADSRIRAVQSDLSLRSRFTDTLGCGVMPSFPPGSPQYWPHPT
eukprot:EG_transcript_39576